MPDYVIGFVNDIPTAISPGGLSAIDFYAETIAVTTEIGVAGTGYNAAHTVFTVPAGRLYNGLIPQLWIDVNGFWKTADIDFDYEASANASTFTFFTPIPKDARVGMRWMAGATTYNEETILVTNDVGSSGAGWNAAHTVFTVPNGKTYDGTTNKLYVDANGFLQTIGVDVVFVNNIAATQFTLSKAVPKYGRVTMRWIVT